MFRSIERSHKSLPRTNIISTNISQKMREKSCFCIQPFIQLLAQLIDRLKESRIKKKSFSLHFLFYSFEGLLVRLIKNHRVYNDYFWKSFRTNTNGNSIDECNTTDHSKKKKYRKNIYKITKGNRIKLDEIRSIEINFIRLTKWERERERISWYRQQIDCITYTILKFNWKWEAKKLPANCIVAAERKKLATQRMAKEREHERGKKPVSGVYFHCVNSIEKSVFSHSYSFHWAIILDWSGNLIESNFYC